MVYLMNWFLACCSIVVNSRGQYAVHGTLGSKHIDASGHTEQRNKTVRYVWLTRGYADLQCDTVIETIIG
jgi:hypothetical protein